MRTEKVFAEIPESDLGQLERSVDGKTVSEIWIGRQTSIHRSDLRDDWHNYSDALGKTNRGLGHAVALGSIAVTYVSATEMGRMVQEKYPRIQDDRKKMNSVVKRIAKDMNGFFRRQSHDIVIEESNLLERQKQLLNQQEYEVDDPDFGDTYFSFFDDGKPKKYLGDFDGKIWGVGDFSLGNIGLFGRDGLGFRIDEHVIKWEMEETIDYLSKERLNTRKIDRERQPHIVTFHSFAPIPNTGLQVPKFHPPTIRLDEPKAVTTHI